MWQFRKNILQKLANSCYFFQDHPAAAGDGGHKQLQNTIPGGW
jgi:hypothetical protein